jgi:hypothetical protein
MRVKAKRIVSVIGIVAVAIGVLTAAGCSSGQSSAQTTVHSATQSTAQASTQGSTAASAQVLPVAQNPIVNTSTKAGLKIVSAVVENNVDPATKKDISDRLQITLRNTGNETLTNLEVYYQMTDTTSQATEGYYQRLTGFSLAPGAEGTVFFDNETGPGHYPENKFSLYRTSPNEVVFSIEVSAPGYAPAMGEAVKAVGTGENASE